MADEDEVGLPQKGLNMIIKDVLPDLRIANESRELLNQCCVEFVRRVSREAQRISSQDQRKTIYHDHVQKALSNLGFPSDYITAADSVLDECKIAAEKRLKRKKSRLDKCGIPEEELYLMQQELIEKARREEAEKQNLLYQQQQTQQTCASASGSSDLFGVQQNEWTSLIATAQQNPELMSQILASNALPAKWTSVLTTSYQQTIPVAGDSSLHAKQTTNKSENGTDASNSTSDSKTMEDAGAMGSSNNVHTEPSVDMSGEMRSRLAANFVASLKPTNADEEDDFD